MYISEIFTSAPTDERIPVERQTYDTLEALKIPFERVDNDAAYSMEECEEISKLLDVAICKNIFLCNQKKTSFYLLLLPGEKAFDTKSFCKKTGLSHVSFAPEEKMIELLDTIPGSASVFGVLNDKDDYVQVLIDKEIADAEWFGCNPGNNTSHLKFKTKDLLNKVLPHARHRARVIRL